MCHGQKPLRIVSKPDEEPYAWNAIGTRLLLHHRTMTQRIMCRRMCDGNLETGAYASGLALAVFALCSLSGPDLCAEELPHKHQREQIRAGELHYCRIPRVEWPARLAVANSMGINTVSTYVFWNLHERRRGVFNFEGEIDFGAFITACQKQGMKVIVRPGPYVCAEWELGGIPGWVLAERDVKLRSTDPRFLDPAKRWMRTVGELLAPLSAEKGGPVLMVQLENEYGAYGSDAEYLRAIEGALREGGYDGKVFTCDAASKKALRNGGLDQMFKAVNFGRDAPRAFRTLEQVAPGQTRFTAEHWVGWFDQWGRPHHVVETRAKAADLEWMMTNGVSFNMYMFHGGTTRGFWTGANWDGRYRPTTTSYDYSAPLDESGRPTPKYHAFRSIITKYLPKGSVPDVPDIDPPGTIGSLPLTENRALLGAVPPGEVREPPVTMEQLGQITGFMLYRTKIDGPVDDPLVLGEVKDRAHVVVDGKLVGIAGRSVDRATVELALGSGPHRLDILVENMGRINYGQEMNEERKGLAGPVKLGDQEISRFEHVSLPLDVPPGDGFDEIPGDGRIADCPVLLRGKFRAQPVDTWLDLRGFGRGAVWLNGINLGRYWSIGPQQTLFVPAVWLRGDGDNEICVLELEKQDCPLTIPTVDEAIWSVATPAE